MSITNGVMFGEKHSYRDMGLILVNKKIGEPQVQTKTVVVPSRNGSVDMSEVLAGAVRYGDREISLKFRSLTPYKDRFSVISSVANLIHGEKMQIIFDDDAFFYYLGRIEITGISDNKGALDLELKCTCDPYKYSITTSADDWLWDPFDFEQGVINETSNMIVDGSLEYTLICSKRWESPTIISSANMLLDVDGTEYEIEAGTQILYDLILTEGEHVFTFTGTGVVTIVYVGGML